MNYCVPDFGIEEEDPFASSLRFPNRKLLQDEGDVDISEILWHKGPFFRRFPPPDRSFEDNQNRVGGADAAASAAAETAAGELFMGEDEMASWLHYSPEHTTANAETENQQVLDRNRTIMAPPSSLQPSTTTMLTQPRLAGSQLVASMSSTVVESNVVMDMAPPPLESRGSTEAVTRRNDIPRVFEKVGASSSIPMHGDDRKRKSRDSDDSDGEDADYDSDDKKKDSRRPARRSRAAEVHNLSERRRRDRINEKMKALQQLIPRCNKSDKASMLDDAVEYLKSLQLQIQMMSMGCQMNPMMYSGIPQYAAPMGMPIRMGVDHTMLPFQQVMQGGTVPAATAAHLSSRLPMPAAFHPAAMAAVNGQLRAQTTTGLQLDPQPNFVCFRGPNPAVMPNLTNPYTQQYYGFQLPSQNQAVTEPRTSKQEQNQN